MRITLSTGTPAEIARPATGEVVGGLVLWPDILSLRPLFDAHCQRLADETGFDQVGVLGFCMGGMYAMKSLASDRFSRGVAFYGMVRVPESWQGPGQGDALDVVLERQAKGDLAFMCIFGTGDPWCPPADMDDVEAAGVTVLRYEGAGHGWAHAPDRDSYRPTDAADAWRRAEEFLTAP